MVGRDAARGLVLLELTLWLVVVMLAVVVVSLVIRQGRHQARLGQLGAEFQTFAAGFAAARAERGRWPATAEEAGPRVWDAGWDDGSPFGGAYGWVPPAAGRPGLITLGAFAPNFPLALNRRDLEAVDRAIDDGDLGHGRFRTGFNGWPVYEMTEKP